MRHNATGHGGAGYRQVGEEAKADRSGEEEAKRTQDLYYGVIKKNTDLFSSEEAQCILKKLIEFAQKKGLPYKVAKDKYKLTLKFMNQDYEELEMNIKILKN